MKNSLEITIKKQMGKIPPRAYLLLVVMLMASGRLHSQEQVKTVPDGTEGERIEIIDTTVSKPKKPFNQFDLGFTTLKIGVAFLYEYAGFSQDATAKEQMDSAKVELKSAFDVRDFRFLLSGKFNTRRSVTWKAGVMYDGSLDSWFIRESGFTIAVPELWGHIFVGRTKEGVSLTKVMSGYAVETMERYMASDPIQILADGIKWMGYLPKSGIFWNAGVYADWFSKKQSFNLDRWQFATRIGWMPINTATTKLHIAANIRFGHPEKDTIRLKSRPESNPAPFFIDTGKFPADESTSYGGEAYYSSGRWQFGSEYFWHRYKSPVKANPVFHGGELMASYFITNDSRPYSTDGGNIFGYVPVKKSVFKGGLGALEAVVRFSTFNLDDGLVHGGRFWKFTPMVNWYVSNNLRLEMAYGYGVLDRFNVNGATQFFQTRLQFALR